MYAKRYKSRTILGNAFAFKKINKQETKLKTSVSYDKKGTTIKIAEKLKSKFKIGLQNAM